MFFFGFSPPKTGPEWHPRESPPSHPRHAGGQGPARLQLQPPLSPQLKSVGLAFSGEMLDADRRWGSGGGGVICSGSHSPSLHLPSNLAPSMDEVLHCHMEKCLFPSWSLSLQVHLGASPRLSARWSSCSLLTPPPTWRGPLVPKCPADKALSHAFLGTAETLHDPHPSPSVVPSEAQGQRKYSSQGSGKGL